MVLDVYAWLHVAMKHFIKALTLADCQNVIRFLPLCSKSGWDVSPLSIDCGYFGFGSLVFLFEVVLFLLSVSVKYTILHCYNFFMSPLFPFFWVNLFYYHWLITWHYGGSNHCAGGQNESPFHVCTFFWLANLLPPSIMNACIFDIWWKWYIIMHEFAFNHHSHPRSKIAHPHYVALKT